MSDKTLSTRARHRIVQQGYYLAAELEKPKPLSSSIVQDLLRVVQAYQADERFNRESACYLIEILQKYVIADRMTEEERDVCRKLAEKFPPLVDYSETLPVESEEA